MSDELEDLDTKTVRQLDLPRTLQSPQGLFGLKFPKVIIPVFVTNLLEKLPHKFSDLSEPIGNGHKFTAPIDARRILYEATFVFSASGTVGNRAVQIFRRDKEGTRFFGLYTEDTLTQSTVGRYYLGPASATVVMEGVSIQLAYPLTLEPEWYFEVRDGNTIDNVNDVLTWHIDYVEVPT